MTGFSKKTIRWIFVTFGTLFFCIYISLFVSWGNISNSPAAQFDVNMVPIELVLGQPDYAVNYTAIRATFFQTRATLFEPLTALSLSQVHPRSTTVIHSRITPIGFPGIIVVLAGIVDVGVFMFGFEFFNLLLISIIPFVAVITPRLFYAVLKPVFGKRVSLLSALVLYVMPLWWYYAHWPLQHHTLLIFFLLSFLYAARKSVRTKRRDWKKRSAYAALAGVTFALCIYLRPAEVVWVTGLLIALSIQFRKRITLYSVVLPFLIFSGFIAVFFFVTQIWFYGDLFGSGYAVPTDSGDSGSIISGALQKPLAILLFLPQGFEAYTMMRNIYGYIWTLLAPWTILGIVGLIHLFTKANQSFRRYHVIKQYSYYVVSISVYLIIVYGSAAFTDNLAAVQYTIGSSHTRYWLPIFVFAIPLCVRGALAIVQPLKKTYRSFLLLGVLLLLGCWSGNLVYNSADGIDQLKASSEQFYAERSLVKQFTSQDAVIVTPFADKYLYPARAVIVTLDQEPQKATEAIVRLQKEQIPVYYYLNTLSEEVEAQRRALFLDDGINLSEEPIFEEYGMQLWKLEEYIVPSSVQG